MQRFIIACVAFLFTVIMTPLAGNTQEGNWVEKSNEYAQDALEVEASFSPEFASQFGIDGYDDQIVDWIDRVRISGLSAQTRFRAAFSAIASMP